MADVIDLKGKPHAADIDKTTCEMVAEQIPSQGMSTIVVIGWRKDGSFYFDSNVDDGPDVLWLIETLRNELMSPTAPTLPCKPGA